MQNRKVALSASIMCIDWLDAGRQLLTLEELDIDYLHFDIIDGRFAPDFTMGSSIINKIRSNSSLPSDYHLMVEEPNQLFDAFQISEGDIFTIHQECSRNLHRDIIRLRNRGAKVGAAICPGTSLETLDYVIEDLDIILVMTVNPGYMGQALVPQTLRKIEKLRKTIDNLGLLSKISVDGNVNRENIPDMVAAGADILVLGSSGLFRQDVSLSESMESIRDCIGKGLRKK